MLKCFCGEYLRQKGNSLSINRAIGIIRREVVLMTAYEIIMVFIGILGLLISREFDNLIRYEVHQSQIWLIFFVKS